MTEGWNFLLGLTIIHLNWWLFVWMAYKLGKEEYESTR